MDNCVQNKPLHNMYNVSFTNGSMLCIYLIDNQFVFHKLWCLFCINHNDEKRMNKIFRYNGGLMILILIFIIALVSATITLLIY